MYSSEDRRELPSTILLHMETADFRIWVANPNRSSLGNRSVQR